MLRFLPPALFLSLALTGCNNPAPALTDADEQPTSRPALVPRLQSPSNERNPSLAFPQPKFDRPSKAAPTPVVAPSAFVAPPVVGPSSGSVGRFDGPPLARSVPSPPVRAPLSGARVAQLRNQIARYKLFAAYRELVELNKNAGLFDEAARLNREQAAQYLAKGMRDAALIAQNEAGAFEPQVRLFVETPVNAQQAADRTSSAVNEPVTGCYLGAFIDRDDNLGPTFFEDDHSQTYRSPEQFMDATGRHLGSQFTYLTYGKPFPRAWAYRLKARGTIPHIAWEPTTSKRYTSNARRLGEVRDDAYLREFAQEVRDFDFPVFIRFASEMNGFWTHSQYGWDGNPQLYREKFRLVNRVLHEIAPRAATVWCVNNPPLDTHLSNGQPVSYLDYYPGDDGCDWVGINFYSVPFHEDKLGQPAFDENPLALLEPVYNRFASRKPIAICEFAASHEANVDRKLRAEFAAAKIRLVYGALPLLYPRVKLVDWFNLNTIKYRSAGKTPNDYLLTDNEQVLRAWQEVTLNRHYLQAFLALGETIPPVYRPLGGQFIPNPTKIGVWARNFGPDGTVYFGIDGKSWTKARSNGATYLDFNPRALGSGSHTLSALLYDARNRFQKRVDVRFQS